MQVLLDHLDIDLYASNKDGWTAFMFACRYGRQDVVKLSNEIFLAISEKGTSFGKSQLLNGANFGNLCMNASEASSGF